MPRLTTTAMVMCLSATSAFATAPPARNAAEPVSNRGQIATERSWKERDARELAEFRQMVAGLCDAHEDRMTARYREINTRMLAAMSREIEQSRLKNAQAAGEENEARRGTAAERMEAGQTGGTGDYLQAIDDRNDHRTATNRCDEMQRIGTLSASLKSSIERGDRPAMTKNIELAGGFLALMRADLRATRAETEAGAR